MAQSILLTWYGITDLRSAFGFEPSGPVVGALKAHNYDRVVVLGYSDDLKQERLGTFDDSVLTGALATVDRNSRLATQGLVDRFANTKQAHKWFCEWIRNELHTFSPATELVFRPIHLKDLNDTEGIYEAAVGELEAIGSSREESEVSLFLSPGTPVMAFVWAFAALNFPRIRKRLISSSRGGQQPETISLPQEWLEWNGRRLKGPMEERKSFDLIFHLFGEQKLPSYWGVSQYAARFHVFVTSDAYSPEALAPFMNGARPFVLKVDAFDPEDVRTKMLDALDRMKAPPSAKIGFNLTGGTKLMYAGAMAACRKINGTPFYFNHQSNSVIDLLTFEQTPIKPIESVETYLRLHGAGMKVSCAGLWDKIPDVFANGREELTSFLWNHRSDIADTYKSIVGMTDWHGVQGKDAKRLAKEGCVAFTYPRPGSGTGAHGIEAASEWDRSASFAMGEKRFVFDHFPYFAKYITGGWFEEYLYSQLKVLETEGMISDLRIGLTLAFDAEVPARTNKQGRYLPARKEEKTFQEFDLLFTDGSRLYIVECKAGNVTSDHVVKLADEVRHYGGIGGRGILAACFAPSDAAVGKRLEEARSCRLVSGEDLCGQIQKIIEADRRSYI